MRVVELHEEMEVKEVPEVVDFDQLVRIFVDTDVDTHFIVSLSRTSTVAELRELVKVTHRHCYPDSGDIDIGKLAVPGGDYGYHLADFLLIGQVYDRYEGKVFAEVKNHDPASNSSRRLFRMPALSFRTGSTQKKVPLLAPQPFENVAGQVSTNASEPGALLPVGSNPCEPRIELIVPKLQKEEIDEDGNCVLGSQEPLDGLSSRARRLAVGTFERIDEEEDDKLVERSSTAANEGGAEVSGADLVPKLTHLNRDMCSARLHVKPDKTSLGATNIVSSDTQGVSRKRNASESNDRPSKSRRLTEQGPSGNTSKAPLENGRHENRNEAIERSKDESSNLDGMSNVVKDVNAATSLSYVNRSGDLDANYLSSFGSKRKKKKTLHIYDLTISENRSEAVIYVNGSGVEGSGINGPEVGREEKSFSLPEDAGVPPALDQKGKKKRKPKQEKKQKQEKEPEQEEGEMTEKQGKMEKKQKQKEPEQEKEPEQDKEEMTEKEKKQKKQKQKEPEQEKELEEEKEPEQDKEEMVEKKGKKGRKEEMVEKKGKKQKQKEPEQEKEEIAEKKGKKGKNEKKQKQKELQHEKELEEEKEPEQEKELEHEKELEQEKDETTEKKVKKGKNEKKEKKQKQKEPQQEKAEKKEKGKKEKKQKQEKAEKKGEKEKKERKQKQIIEEITPLDSASLNPLLEESGMEPQQENGHLGAAAVSPDLSQHVDNDEKDSDDDVPDLKRNKGVKKKGNTAAASVAYDFRSRMGDEDLERPSASDFLNDEVSESGTPQREAQVSRDTSGEGMTSNVVMATGSVNIVEKVLPPKTNLYGDVNNGETSPFYQGGTENSPQAQHTKVGSVEFQETPNPSKHLSYTRAGRGAPSQTRSIESSRDVTEGKQIGGRDCKTNESQSSQCSEKATQQSEGINLGSEVSGAWLRRDMLESEPEHIDQSQVAKPGEVAYSRSSTGESSAESDPRFADQTKVRSHQDVSRKVDQITEALHTNHRSRTVKSLENHVSTFVKKSDGGEVNIKNDSLEFFSQDQSFHVAPTQVEKALSDSTTEDSSDESDSDPVEGTYKLKKQIAGNLNTTHKGGGESEESSDESGDLAVRGRRGFFSLTTRTPLPSVSRMTGNGGSQSFKRRASGVAAEIEAKFAQFIESQGGLDEIMGITLGQRKRSMPVESSAQVGLGARSTGSLATPFGSPLDLALNSQESVKNSPIALDIAQASQNSAGKYFTPQFKVPKPVPIETIAGGVQGVFNSAVSTVPSAVREVPKVRAIKELRLKRKEPTLQVDKTKETGSLLVKHNNSNPLPAIESSKETFLDDEGAAEGKPKSAGKSSLLSPPETPKGTFLDDLNAAEKRESSVGKGSDKKNRLEEKYQGSQFMIVNNTDHILEHEREDKRLGSEDETKGPSGVNEDGSLVSPKMSGKKSKELKVKRESVETGVVGSPDMFVLDSSGKKKRKKSEKEGTRKKRMKFLPEELDGKEVTILPENSVERSARETEELYFKLEKANRDLWLQNNSVSSFRKEEEKIENRDYPAADLDDTEGAEGEDVAQSRLAGGEIEIDDSGNDKSNVVADAPVHRDPSPELCAGTTEASDREDSAFQSQDDKAETFQPDKFKSTDVYDYVSGDELPTKALSKSAKNSETNEKKKVKRMEELSGRAVQRVLDDEMLHVVDTNDVPGKKSRKDAKPVKWTVRMRALSPSALATSLHGGTVPSDATELGSSPNIILKSAGGALGRGRVQIKREVADIKPRSITKTPLIPKQSGPEMCPLGCGRGYSKKTAAYYLHRKKCTGAPLD